MDGTYIYTSAKRTYVVHCLGFERAEVKLRAFLLRVNIILNVEIMKSLGIAEKNCLLFLEQGSMQIYLFPRYDEICFQCYRV